MERILAKGLAAMLAKELNPDQDFNKQHSNVSPKEHMKNLMHAKSFFDAKIILKHVQSIEPNRAVLKKEIKSIMRLNVCQLEQSGNIGDILKYFMLSSKYRIKEAESCGPDDISFGNLIWTFPDFGYYQMIKHPQFKFPWSDALMKDYPTFKVIYHNPGLLGMMPKGKKYGGLAKAIVDLGYLVSVRVKDINTCVAIARAVYTSSLATDERREQWFPNLQITEEDCAVWSEIFDRKYPKHVDIYKFFDQVA